MMKQAILISAITVTGLFANAQNPVRWLFSSKKVDEKTVEILLTAVIEKPWHIYSQSTPAGGPVPTKISFNKNPLILITGNIAEEGKMQTRYEDVFGIDVKFFDEKVVFVQKAKVKANVKTSISGSIEFMGCNDEKCLPPKTVAFTIPLK